MTKQELATKLTFAGGIPFIIGGFTFLFEPLQQAHLIRVLFAYAAIIASFMAGIHWGAYLFKNIPINLFIHSNVLALIAWISLFFPPFITFPLLIICFVYLLIVDHRLYKFDIIQIWYWRLRVRITCLVVVSLLFAWVLSN